MQTIIREGLWVSCPLLEETKRGRGRGRGRREIKAVLNSTTDRQKYTPDFLQWKGANGQKQECQKQNLA